MRYLIIMILSVSLLGSKPKKEEPKSEKECQEYCNQFVGHDQLQCFFEHRWEPNVNSKCDLIVSNNLKECIDECEGQS